MHLNSCAPIARPLRLSLTIAECPYPARIRAILEAAGYQIVAGGEAGEVRVVWANSTTHRALLREVVPSSPYMIAYYAPVSALQVPPDGPGPIGLSLRPGTPLCSALDTPQLGRCRDTEEARAVRAGRGITRLRAERLTRFNEFPALPGDVLPPDPDAPVVLVADQCADAWDIASMDRPREQAREMLNAAVSENRDALVVVKRHPEAALRRRPPLLDAAACVRAGAVLIDEAVEPWGLITRARSFYTLTSDMGLEALFAGVPVHCFGAPSYAYRGLTQDRARLDSDNPAGAPATVEELFADAYLDRTLYFDPFAGQLCSFESAAEIMAQWRRINERNAATHICVGVKWWNRRSVRQLLQSTRGTVRFVRRPSRAVSLAAGAGGRVVVWASRETEALQQACRLHDIPLLRVEDGFIRSVGLGTHYVPASSLVLDSRGIYYDPRQSSDLEWLIENAEFSDELRDRAQRLRHRIVSAGLSKYNVGGSGGFTSPPKERKSILVPGQVENDASIRYGTAKISTNLDLLRSVRRSEPEAHIIFKPHPDVELGGRPGRVPEADALDHVDQIVRHAPIAAVLDAVDEVHTMTSLVGFEGILREKNVVVYGTPFYSGWGLTADRVPVPERHRLLTVDELVGAVLLLYPDYLDYRSGLHCSAETILERFEEGAGAYESVLPIGHRVAMTVRRWFATRRA